MVQKWLCNPLEPGGCTHRRLYREETLLFARTMYLSVSYDYHNKLRLYS
jgi:hypothetical protein